MFCEIENQKYRILISRYLSNKLSPKETRELLSCLEADKEREELFNELGDAWMEIRNYPEGFDLDINRGWKRLRLAIINSEDLQKTKNTNYRGIFEGIIKNIKIHFK